jgi:hypothetical protein
MNFALLRSIESQFETRGSFLQQQRIDRSRHFFPAHDIVGDLPRGRQFCGRAPPIAAPSVEFQCYPAMLPQFKIFTKFLHLPGLSLPPFFGVSDTIQMSPPMWGLFEVIGVFTAVVSATREQTWLVMWTVGLLTFALLMLFTWAGECLFAALLLRRRGRPICRLSDSPDRWLRLRSLIAVAPQRIEPMWLFMWVAGIVCFALLLAFTWACKRL